MQKQILLFLLILGIALSACQRNVDVLPEKNTENEIIAFKIIELASICDGLIEIDHDNARIIFDAPEETPLNGLTPIVEIPYGATIYPESGSEQDFTKTIIYTVTSENGNVRRYEVVVK